MVGKRTEVLYVLDFLSTVKIDPNKSITDVVMFYGASNFQLAGELLKIYYPKVSVMRGVEHTVSLFFNDVSKIPVVNQMITDYKAIYNLFGSGIYQKFNYILKPKSYEFQYKNIGLFRGNDTRIAGYFIGIHIYLRTRKAFLATFSSAELENMPLNSKVSKVLSYIPDIYVLLKILFPFLWFLCLADS